jgi:hypothetical protein
MSESGIRNILLLAGSGDERPQTEFDDIEVGSDLGELLATFTRESVEGLLSNDSEYDPWYESKATGGGGIVPCLATYPPVRALFAQRFNIRGFLVSYSSEFLQPIEYGVALTLTGKIVGKWVKRDRAYVQYEAEGSDVNGIVYFRTMRTHTLDYRIFNPTPGARGK